MVVFVSCLVLVAGLSRGSAQGTIGANVVILLRLTGDSPALPNIRACLAARLSRMPDIKLASLPTDRVRFVLDIVAGRRVSATLIAGLGSAWKLFRWTVSSANQEG